MTRAETKAALADWKPSPPGDGPEGVPPTDPALREWFERHQAFQRGTLEALRQVQPPPDLAERILRQHRERTAPILRPRFRPLPLPWAMVLSGIAVVLTLLVWIPFRQAANEPSSFATFHSRMVRAALREYRMDLTTNNLAAIRSFLRDQAAPADFALPPALAERPAMGGGLLRFQGAPVSMVCLTHPDWGILYLFAVSSDALGQPPNPSPRQDQISRLSTVSWEQDQVTFVLAAAAPGDELRRLIPDSP